MPPIHDAAMVAAATRKTIDPVQLQSLEHVFRTWTNTPEGVKRKLSRKRVLLVFLLIRYTGAKLNEILHLDPVHDVDIENRKVLFRKASGSRREVQIPELLAGEIRDALDAYRMSGARSDIFRIDPAHVRRKFYECADAAGIPRELGTPEAIRRSRAVELMQSNVPLPVVQTIMGHATPNLAAGYVEFSEDEIKKVERFHVERENRRKTSARNSFFGKVDLVRTGGVQATVEILSIDGQRIHSVVTKDSRNRLGLKPGRLVAVEVKAPWVIIFKGERPPQCSAENRFQGAVVRVLKGKINSEVIVKISDRTELCSVLTENSRASMGLENGDPVWVVFNASMTVIHVD